MGESVPSAVSVSFGRFESDSLSWEKWSSFSPNKYLEEVGKCSTPGSVAQKKAYFEAHYKKIAARKNEELEQEKLMECVPPSTDEPDIQAHVKNTSVADGELGVSGSRRSAEEVEPDVATANILNSTTIEEEKEHGAIGSDCQDLLVGEAKEDLSGNSVSPESNDVQTGKEELLSNQAELEVCGVEEATVVEEDTSQKNSLEIVEHPLKLDHEAKKIIVNKTKSPKSYSGKITQKVTPIRKEQSLTGAKKKVVSPATKSSMVNKLSQFSTPRLSRSTMMAASLSSTKKVNGSSSLPRAKNAPGENRRPMHTSLNMSLSLDAASSGPSLTTTRKSFIMESMGNKDIVKRVFKTFQNSINGLKSSNDEISGGKQQGHEKKTSTTLTPRKEKEGLRKSAEEVIQRGQSGNTANPVKSGSVKSSGVDKRSRTVVSSFTSVKNDAKAEKWKEKPGEKSFVSEAERSHLISIEKDDDAQLKNLRGLKSKTTLAPAFNRGKVNTKILSEKEEKSKNHHRPMAKR